MEKINQNKIHLKIDIPGCFEKILTPDFIAQTPVVNSVCGVNNDNPTEITCEDINDVMKAFLDNNADELSKDMEDEDKFGASPCLSSFIAFFPPEIEEDFRRVCRFLDVSKYAVPEQAYKNEIGCSGNMRMVRRETFTEKNASLNKNDVYDVICCMYMWGKYDHERYVVDFLNLRCTKRNRENNGDNNN